MSNMNPVVHFEMPYEDRDRMAEFYAKAFGWKMLKLGEEMNNYVIAHTTETDENNMIQKKGAINGGFFQKERDNPSQYPSVVIAVGDINAAIEKINGAGGKVFGKPVVISGIGQYASFKDTEGNRISILQPDM